ncbi:MAG TPA: segregation/condensation protein A [Chloroflexota bacterium]|nr:segregation/condensation protein A [Chloroflexota bacterium]
MSQSYQLTLPGFAGTVEELPAFVAADSASLTQFPLAQIPRQVLHQMSSAEALDLEQTGEVLVTAARLLLLKSGLLLAVPDDAPEESAPAVERADPVELRATARRLAERQGQESLPAPGRLDLVNPRVEPRSAGLLTRAWDALVAREVGKVVHASVPGFVRLEAAISRLLGGLRVGRRLVLREAMQGATRREAVMLFLAALELNRRGQAEIQQDRLFGDVVLHMDAAEGEVDEERAG